MKETQNLRLLKIFKISKNQIYRQRAAGHTPQGEIKRSNPFRVASVEFHTTKTHLQKSHKTMRSSSTIRLMNKGTEMTQFALRDKGSKHAVLASLQPSDGRYDKLMSYGYYRID